MFKCIAAVGTVVWMTMFLFLYLQLSNNQSSGGDSIRAWRQTKEAIDKLQEQNEKLKSIMENERRERNDQHRKILEQSHQVPANPESQSIPKPEPVKKLVAKPNKLGTIEQEVQKRMLDDRIREMFYLVHSQSIENSTKALIENQMISLMALSAKLEKLEGSEDERMSQRSEITNRILKSIEKLQNPQSCGDVNTLVCNLDKECGFGCQLHHVTYCAITAFATKRMMILKRDGSSWKYSSRGWTSVFEPISKCSFDDAVGKAEMKPFADPSPERVVSLGIVDSLLTKPAFLPQAIPEQLLSTLSSLHSHPPAFFVGTFISYLMRFNAETKEKLEAALKAIPFSEGPVVGLQIRRTDKVGTEAAFHALKEYMEWAEIWFKIEERRQGKPLKRMVFIASDDPTVVPEAQNNYPEYKVYGSTEIAKTAQLNNRYTDASLMGVITDIYILSKVDYLVCTFSSQVCRMGYELRQPSGADDGSKFHSLDDIYYFGGQQAHEVVVIEDHVALNNKEIDLKVGDKVGIAGNHWDGYSKGTNRRTYKEGVFPSYKVVNDWRQFNFEALLD
ncbi:CRE-FUT-8 protein [Caenorhabditis remanei]|uniref:Alpha-(1,6)-fucosyltransferase n=1 Tax=Caenorhabditis remanei TaxID=31234 RepID=E3LUK0_CAERE|nr:CRE-FUT-8 protein [Caenorhabditis remanei]